MEAEMDSDLGGDRLTLYGAEFSSRLLAGTAQYPSPAILSRAIAAAKAEIVTVSLRRESGCRSVREAVTTAQMAREVFDTPWIKLEVIGEEDTLQPDVFGLVEAASILTRDGFQVFPYTTEDLVAAEKLLGAGCEVLMPWGSPIGSGRGLNNPYALKSLRAHFPDVPMIIDAGIGAPSHAAVAMEMGFDAVLSNTAIAKAGDPVKMARAFALAVEAGRTGYRADLMQARDMAAPSTPVIGRAFSSRARA